jgi:hypothetical protein
MYFMKKEALVPDPATVSATLAAAKLLERPLAAIAGAATGPLKILASRWVLAGKRDAIVQTIAEVEKVRTIIGPDRIPLSSFYYPCKIAEGRPLQRVSNTARHVETASEIAEDKNILIYGTIGQGKSILMKYLCVQELKQGRKIPIFIELRTIEAGSSLKFTILQTLNSIGFGELTDADLQFLLNTGSIIFFLDGFDEVKRELAMSVEREFKALKTFAPQTRWVISSRPGSLSGHISALPFIHHVHIAPLADDDFGPFLEALRAPAESKAKLLEAINASPMEIKGVLRTPLMLTLLNMTFGTSTHIPSTLHEFYESLFLFLVYRHDETKLGYVRQKATQLSNSDLQNAFEHFAFLSKECGVSLSDEEFSIYAKNASKLCGLEFTPEGFRADLTETVCLMIRDGLKTAFIHRSVQEFYAAFFVKHLGEEEQVKLIYERLRGGIVLNWQQEIRFLEQIDKYRYIEYFRLPAIRDFLEKCSYNPKRAISVSKAAFLKYLSSQPIISTTISSHTIILGITSDSEFDVFTLEVCRLLNCRGFISDPDLLPAAANPKFVRLDRRFSVSSTEANSALSKFRDFARKIEREQKRLEKALSERKNNFRDLLLPRRAIANASAAR